MHHKKHTLGEGDLHLPVKTYMHHKKHTRRHSYPSLRLRPRFGLCCACTCPTEYVKGSGDRCTRCGLICSTGVCVASCVGKSGAPPNCEAPMISCWSCSKSEKLSWWSCTPSNRLNPERKYYVFVNTNKLCTRTNKQAYKGLYESTCRLWTDRRERHRRGQTHRLVRHGRLRLK